MTLSGARALLVVFPLAVAGVARAQAPALSGLSPTPTPPVARSGDWEAPTPAPTPPPKLTKAADPAADTGKKGQSLADVVRLSKEARKGQPAKKSLGTITNENLHKGASAPPAPAKAAAKGAAAGGRAAEPTRVPTYDVIRDDTGRSEADWRSYAAHTRAVAIDAERRVRELDTKAKQLENDFYAQSDGYRRDGSIKPAWDKARDDLAKARTDLDAARKAVDDLQDEARKANANPGWLR
jgi:hypothetical protein